MIKVQTTAVGIAESGLSATRARLAAGDALLEDIARVEIELERVRLELVRALSLREQARAELQAGIGSPGLAIESLEGALDTALEFPNLESLAGRLADHPTLTAAEAEITRCYGAASTTIRSQLGWISRPPVTEPPPESRPAGEIGPGAQAGGGSGLPPGAQVSPPQLPAHTPPDERDSERLKSRRRSWARLISPAGRRLGPLRLRAGGEDRDRSERRPRWEVNADADRVAAMAQNRLLPCPFGSIVEARS